MKTALENLIVVLKDENTISPYEMCSSGLVQALFTVLNNVSVPSTATVRHQHIPSSVLFRDVESPRRLMSNLSVSVCRVWNWT